MEEIFAYLKKSCPSVRKKFPKWNIIINEGSFVATPY